MKKRILTAILCSLLSTSLLSASSFPVLAEENVEVEESISDVKEGQCGYNAYWKLEDGTLTISGNGDLYQNSTPWKENEWSLNNEIKKVIVEEGITSLPTSAFYGCIALEEVQLPTTLTAIPSYAFQDCEILTSIDIPDTVTVIEVSAFSGCINLTEVNLPDVLGKIGYYAFQNCTSLQMVTIPSGISNIDLGTFSGCTNLRSVKLNDDLRTIGEQSFNNCTSMESIIIPKSVYQIGSSAFNGCTALKNITFSYSTFLIGRSAFSQCPSDATVNFYGSRRQFDDLGIESDNDVIKNNVQIHDRPVTEIILSSSDVVTEPYNDFTITAEFVPSDAYDHVIEWEISSQSGTEEEPVVNIDANDSAYITPLRAGTATVTATCVSNGVSASCQITIEDPNPAPTPTPTPEQSYTVQFGDDLGNILSTQTVKDGETAEQIPTPERDGYEFVGWYIDDGVHVWDSVYEEFDFSQPITGDIYVFAKWKKVAWTVVFPDIDREFMAYSSEVIEEPETPAPREHYAFKNWTFQDTDHNYHVYDFSKTIAENIAGLNLSEDLFLYINQNWEAKPVSVVYDMNGVGDTKILTTRTIKYGDNIDIDIYPNIPGYAFLGWFFDKEETDKVSALYSSLDRVANDETLTLYAGWLKFADFSSNTTNVTNTTEVTQVTNIYNIVIGVPDTEHGKTTVTVSDQDKKTARINAVPDDGYEVDNVRVVGKDGKDVDVKKIKENLYEFTISSEDLAVVVSYKAKALPFTDVAETSFCRMAVLWAFENKISTGTSATTFNPNAKCTRGQTAAFIYRMEGSPAVKEKAEFSDVSDDSFCHDAVLWAYENGITTGTGDRKFSPNSSCTRGQAVTFLYKLAGSPAIEGDSPFEDVKEENFYYNAVLWAYKNGITTGTSDKTFSPNAKVTRGQMVTFLYRYHNLSR